MMMKKQRPIHRQVLRQALRSWDHTEELGRNPLTDLQIVEIRRIKSGFQRSDTGYGLALREVLREAIDQFRPTGDLDDPTERVWRTHLILTREFIDNRSPAYLSEQLGIARSTYTKSQGDALDQLADVLIDWERRGASAATARVSREVSTDKPIPAPFMSPHGLVGRKMTLDELRHELISGKDVVLSGLPGVGKSALAVALAHDPEVRNHFQSGVLWAGLGKDGNASAELAKWCAELSLPVDMLTQIEGRSERVGTMRAVIGSRRFLLIVDDVWELTDGLALRVGGQNCAHLFTTRSPGIAEGLANGNTKNVSTLVEVEGVSLLRRFVPGIDTQTAYNLVRLVHGLPIGLVMIGKYLQGAMDRTENGGVAEAIRHLEEALQVEQPNSLLNQRPVLTSDVPIALRKVLQLTIDSLEDHLKEVLGALALFPPMPNTFSEIAALEVSGASIRTLDALVEQGLLEPSGLDRYTLHKITAQYIHSNLEMEYAPDRYIAFYLELIDLYKDDHLILEQEWHNILSALDMARDMDLGVDLVRGCNAFFPHLEKLGHLEEAAKYLGYAEKGSGSEEDKTITMLNLGKLFHRRGDDDQAQGYFTKGLELAQKQEDIDAECAMFHGLGEVARFQARFEEAFDFYQSGLGLARRKEASHHVIDLNLSMAELHIAQDKLRDGDKYYQRALNWARKGENISTISQILARMGQLAVERKEHDQAEEYYRESLVNARVAGEEGRVGELSAILGRMALNRRKFRKAQDYFKDALEMSKRMGNRSLFAEMQGRLGMLAMRDEEFYTAKVLMEAGLRLSRELGEKEHMLELLINLGSLYQQESANSEARSALKEALSLAVEIGHHRYAEIIQKKLTTIDHFPTY